MPNKTLIIAAMSARGYAQAAVACGYEVITLDAFADADTYSIAKQAIKLKFTEDGLDLTEFKHIFSMLDFSNCAGFLYGSLFDDAPDLLAWVADCMPIIGNAPEVMQFAKSVAFFELLDTLDVQHPEISKTLSDVKTENWLSKQLGGTGGTHIKPANASKNAAHGKQYFQRKMAGDPISLLFVANRKQAKTIGFNLQLLAPTVKSPYRYAGAVSHYPLPETAKLALENAAQKMTEKLGLRGCNSLDAIFDGEHIWVIELNPRLSATFHLYPNLMQAHLQACAGHLATLPPVKNAVANCVLYADKAVEISTEFAWPPDVMDIPTVEDGGSSVKIAQDAPICTLYAKSTTAKLAHQKVFENTRQLKERLI